MYISDNCNDNLNYSEDFLEELSKFCSNLDLSDFRNLVVVLPDFLSVNLFKYKFAFEVIKKNGQNSTVLPEVFTLEQFSSEFIFNQGHLNLQYFQEILAITDIITSNYGDFYKIPEALNIASDIYQIHKKINKYGFQYDEIHSWVDQDLAQHWWDTAEFLQLIFEKLDLLRKDYSFSFDTSPKQKLSDKTLILAGILDVHSHEFNMSAKLDCKKYIIPPYINSETLEKNSYIKDIQLHYQKIFDAQNTLNLKFNNINLEKGNEKFIKNFDSLNNDNINSDTQKSNKKCFLYEFEDVFEEANFIFERIKNRRSSIAIITSNERLENLLNIKLSSNNIEFNSNFRKPYLNFAEAELFLSLAKFLSTHGDSRAFYSLINIRILKETKYLDELISILDEADIFFENFDVIIEYVHNNLVSNTYIENFLHVLKNWLDKKNNNTRDLLKENYLVFKKIYKLFKCSSNQDRADKFKNFIESIISFPNLPAVCPIEDYNELICSIFSLKITKPFSRESSIFISNYEESNLLFAEEIIFAGFNQNYVMGIDENDIWLSQKILKKLNLINESEKFWNIHHLISSKLNLADTCITRSLYKSGELQECCAVAGFIKNIEYVKKDKIIPASKELYYPVVKVNADALPYTLYASNIETLLRNPYGFFARKVLKLRYHKSMIDDPKSNDFGTIVHAVIEEITNKPDDKLTLLIENILDKKKLPKLFRNLWTEPLSFIAFEVSKINEELRNNGCKIFTEIEGAFKLSFQKRDINIKAIADRIEILPNKIRVIDYKTGSPPTKSDIFKGKAPQLLIEAMILLENGYQNYGLKYKGEDIELVYIKVNTKYPFLEEKVISISKSEIIEHKKEMVMFLGYYYDVNEVSFQQKPLPDFWAPLYDDYRFLRREY